MEPEKVIRKLTLSGIILQLEVTVGITNSTILSFIHVKGDYLQPTQG